MSDVQTALRGAESAGYVTVREAPPRDMVQLRGDFGNAAFADAVRLSIGGEFPDPLTMARGDHGAVAWMSPDELLLFPEGSAAEAASRFGERLDGHHHLALDVSDMRAEILLEGEAVREVLAKVVPLDVAALEPGAVRRTRLSQVPAAVWLADERTAHVICFRSVARYVFDVLAISARKGGEVGLFRSFPERAPV